MIGTYSSGFWVLNDGKSRVSQVSGFPSETEATCALWSRGESWVGTSDRGVWILKDGELQAIRLAGISNRAHVTRLRRVDGIVYVCTEGFGLWAANPESGTATKVAGPEENADVYAVSRLTQGTLIAASDGFWMLRPGSQVAEKVPGPPPVFGAEIIRDGTRTWIWGSRRLQLFESQSRSVKTISGLPEEISCVSLRKRDLLVGTIQAGLWALDKHSMAPKSIALSVPGISINDIVSWDHKFIVGTYQSLPH